MKIVRWLIVAGLSLVTMEAAGAFPRTAQGLNDLLVRIQLDCTGPRCLTVGPIRRPYLQGTRPPELPGRELFRRAPEPPRIKPQQPEMDYRVPRLERDQPLVRDIRPPDPTYRVIGLPQQHLDWCFQHYRSYRESDNSYQPFSGPRKQCRSPYG